VQRNPAWHDSLTLAQTDLQSAPRSAKLNLDAGTMLSAKARDAKTETVLDRAKLEQAIGLLAKTIAVIPIPEAFSERALAHLYLGHLDAALADYEVALQALSGDVHVLTNAAKVHFLRGDLARAEQHYLRALELKPDFVLARRNLVHLYAMQKRFPEALDHAKRAIEADSTDAKLWLFAGLILLDMGDRPSARAYFIKALAIDPTLKVPPP